MKLKYLFFLSLLLFLTSCGSSKKVVKHKNVGTVISEPIPERLPSVNQAQVIRELKRNPKDLNKYTLAYIGKYAPIAVKEMYEYRIPASITLAQGILESGRGRSELTLKSNNHFGIKCHADWEGERVYYDDDKKDECFRKYAYPQTSYNDHSLFLSQKKRYAFLFGYKKNYKKWAYGLRKAGYATDRMYPSKLLGLIKKYHLYEFDRIKKNHYKYEVKKQNKSPKTKKSVTKKKTKNYYQVKKGDTLYSISRKFGVSVSFIKEINKLKDTTISIGQFLLIN